MRAIIVASGEAPGDRDWARWVQAEDLIIGADGGAAHALARGLAPDVIVGDMDSFTGPQRDLPAARQARIVQHPRAKDETDLELALAAALATTLYTGSEAACGANFSVFRASVTSIPRTRSTTRRTFSGLILT